MVRERKTSLTTVLDGYDAWDLLQDNADPKRFRLTWLQPGVIKSLRANTWENLYYYQAPAGGVRRGQGARHRRRHRVRARGLQPRARHDRL